MYLLSLKTASPAARYTQADCYNIFRGSKARHRLRERSVTLMEKVLLRNNGIATRGFCYPDVETIFDADPERLNRVFEATAPALGTRALGGALDAAGIAAGDLDGLVVCTCTGYLCPGLSSHIAEQAGLRTDCALTDLVGMGCGAAIPSLRQVHHHLRAEPSARIAMVAVEVCSAAFYLDDDPGVIISACLFGDGAAATIWTGTRPRAGALRADRFHSLHLPEKRQLLRFENSGGALRNRLSKLVPQEAAAAVGRLYSSSHAAEPASPDRVVLPHPGGRDVLDALCEVFPKESFADSREILLHHGNMSSPSVLFVLQQFLHRVPDNRHPLWLTSFGAGFSAYSCRLSPEDGEAGL